MINIVHRCYLGMFGSFDQVSTNQQMLLAGLVSDQEINYEHTFISQFLANHKVFQRENSIKLGGKVSSIILEDLKNQDVLWFYTKQVLTRENLL